ncbi:MAG: NAD(P)H-dependent oxidoreductase subunit E, partial [Candidatus Bipolaricaulaceae bacterium]
AGQTSLVARRWSGAFRRFPRSESSVIPLLQLVQEQEGYIPPKAVRALARRVGAPEARIYGAGAFCARLRVRPRGGLPIRPCQGMARSLQGAGIGRLSALTWTGRKGSR